MKRSKVIIYGLGRYFESAIDDIESRLEVVGYSDSSLQKEGIAKERKRLFIPPKNIKKYDFDYIIITSPDYFSEIKQYIINDLNICDEKVVSYDDLFIKEIYDGCGKLNKDKYFYVIKSSYCSAGLFAQYINVLLHVDKALKEGYLPIVDFKNLPNYYLDVDKLGIENSWEYYFENIIDIPLEEVYNSPNIKFSSDLYFLPKNIEDKKKREYYKKICRECLKINKKTLKIIDEEYKKILKGKDKVCGVLCRGTDYTNAKPYGHGIQPPVEEMIEKVENFINKNNYNYVYLATEDSTVLEKFKEKFGDKLLYTNQMRFKDTGDKWLFQIHNSRENDKYLRGIEYLTTIYLLSKCNSLIAGRCGGAYGALLINDEFEYEYIYDLGRYGIDDK